MECRGGAKHLMKNFFFRAFIVIVVLIVSLVLFFSGFRQIDDGEMGVEIAMIGKHRILPEPLQSGWYWRRPLIVHIVSYSVRENTIHREFPDVTTKDKKLVRVTAELYYELDPQKLVDLHKTYGYSSKIDQKIGNLFQATMLDTLKSMDREDIFSKSKSVLEKEVSDKLVREFDKSGIQIKKVVITSVHFPQRYTDDIAKHYPSVVTSALVKKPCQTSDKSLLYANFQLYYHIEPKDAEYVHNHLGTGFLESYVIPRLKSASDNIFVQYTLDEIYKAESRTAVAKKVLEAIRQDLDTHKIKADDLAIESIEFEAGYQQKLNEIQLMKREKERQELVSEFEAKKIEEEKARKQREREEKKQDAQAEKEQQLIKAEGYKQAEILKAEGKAEALLKVQKVISENPRDRKSVV